MHNYARTSGGYAPGIGATNFIASPGYIATSLVNRNHAESGIPMCIGGLTCLFLTIVLLLVTVPYIGHIGAVVGLIIGMLSVIVITSLVFVKCRQMVWKKKQNINNMQELQQRDSTCTGHHQEHTHLNVPIISDPPSYETATANNRIEGHVIRINDMDIPVTTDNYNKTTGDTSVSVSGSNAQQTCNMVVQGNEIRLVDQVKSQNTNEEQVNSDLSTPFVNNEEQVNSDPFTPFVNNEEQVNSDPSTPFVNNENHVNTDPST